jgi:hypothetical protein
VVAATAISLLPVLLELVAQAVEVELTSSANS